MWEPHAIQVTSINHLKMYIESNPKFGSQSPEQTFSLKVAKTNFNPEDASIGVKISVTIGLSEEGERLDDAEFWMEVIIEGIFKVNLEKFPLEKIDIWAEQNAPMILYPYARETAFSLTNRICKEGAGLLPLLHVPTIKI
ncbi:protein-export chaperone SecB [Shewanella algae]|uniref:protein-export chaperone SecB n=1 Tax=Shewanella algae TaxID=38313 RepID=UPI0031F58505